MTVIRAESFLIIRTVANRAQLYRLRDSENPTHAPYFGAFQSLNATSCKNLSAGTVRFPQCYMDEDLKKQ